jgi:hypothetical protein
MSAVSFPQSPLYRVTLFFGPEPVAGSPPRVRCVFNVKKRSWKGGVQVAVEMEEAQVARLRRAMAFDDWLATALAGVPDAERGAYHSRAQDHFVQAVCSLKLDLATEAGLTQENQTISAGALVDEVDRTALQHTERITNGILVELDLQSSEE